MNALRRIAAVAVAALLLAVWMPPTVGGKPGPFGERCEYVEAGPPGPRGNRLVVIGSDAWLNRHGDRIVVHESIAPCTGREPTVHNIDRIVLGDEYGWWTLSERRGAFAPGATPERSGSEIEITVVGERLELIGGRGADAYRARTIGTETVALNLNAREDGALPDRDVLLSRGKVGVLPMVVGLYGKGGDDVIDARRLTGIGDNVYLRSRIRLFGGRGDDTILGSDGSGYGSRGRTGDDIVRGGPGDDLIRAGGGNDDVEFGPGRDTAYGGPGDDLLAYEFLGSGRRPPDARDRIFGGRGDDTITDGNGRKDAIRCGPGTDVVDREPFDWGYPDCEQRRY